jgi:hypothetical protein
MKIFRRGRDFGFVGTFGSTSGFSRGDVRADDGQVVAGSLERLFSVMVRDKSRVVIEGQVSFSPKAIQNGQQARVFPVNALTDKFDDGDMMARLTTSPKAVAEHKTERIFEHRFVSLLKAGLFVEGEYFPSRCEFLVGARQKPFYLRPVNGVRLEFFHAVL